MSPLAAAIDKEYKLLLEVFLKIPQGARTSKEISGTGGFVSAVDIIAYQIGWGRLLLYWYNSGLEGKLPEMPGEGFKSWHYKGLASHFYKKYAFDQSEIQQEEFHQIVLTIIAMVEIESKADRLEKLGAWPWCTLLSGKQWPLSKWIRVNTVAPYRRATVLLKKFLKSECKQGPQLAGPAQEIK